MTHPIKLRARDYRRIERQHVQDARRLIAERSYSMAVGALARAACAAAKAIEAETCLGLAQAREAMAVTRSTHALPKSGQRT